VTHKGNVDRESVLQNRKDSKQVVVVSGKTLKIRLEEAEKKLAHANWLHGDEPGDEDLKLFAEMKGQDLSGYPHVSRVVNILALMKK